MSGPTTTADSAPAAARPSTPMQPNSTSGGGGGGGGASSEGGAAGGAGGTSPASRLPYPDRFHAAVRFVAAVTATSGGSDSTTLPQLSDEARLLFYALGRQATDGPCSDPKPWGWDVVQAAKWQSWAQLGNMARLEAMRLYVKTLEEEAPGWGALLAAMGDDEVAAGGGGGEQQRVEELGRSLSSAGGGGSGNGDNNKDKQAPPPPPPAEQQQQKQQQHPALPPLHHPSASVVTTLRDACVPGRWVALQLPEGARRPTARYEHASALMDGRLYVVGGHLKGGRAMADVWAFDLERLAWTPLCVGGLGVPGAGAGVSGATGAPVSGGQRPPALIGHTVTPYRGKLVVVGGHVRLGGSGGSGAAGSGGDAAAAAAGQGQGPRRPRNRAEAAGNADAWVFDPAEQHWTRLRPAAPLAPAPCARGAHTAVALGGHELYVYGGEDASRRPLGDLWRLDLDAAVADGVADWKSVEPSAAGFFSSAAADGAAAAGGGAGGGSDADNGDAAVAASAAANARRRSRALPPQPLPRSAHAAVAYQDRYMVVYGGAAMGSGCHGDTWVFDRETGEWSEPSTEHGAVPGLRAGHGGARLGEAWFVLGGGDHVRGCRDVLAADLSQLPGGSVTWSRVSTVPARSPLSSEGASVSAVPRLGALLAFGGYNGRCHDSLSLYKARDEMIEPPGSPQQRKGAAADGAKEEGAGGGAGGSSDAANGGAGPSAENAEAQQQPLLSSLGRAVSALFGSSSNLKTAASEGGAAAGAGAAQAVATEQPAAAAAPSSLAPNGSAPADLAAAAAASSKSARIREEAEAAVAAAEKAEQQQLRRALSPDGGESGGASAPTAPHRTPHEQALLRDLAVQREVLRRELRAAREELADARREREVEVAALKRALSDAHRQLADEQRRAEALERQLADAAEKAGALTGEPAVEEAAAPSASSAGEAATAPAAAADAEAAARARREEEAEARAQAAVVAGGGGVWGLFASSGAAR